MTGNAGTVVKIPEPLARRVSGVARREARPVTQVVLRALRSYLEQQDEAEFVRALRAGARRRGIRSQRDIVRLVDEFRTGR